MVIILSTILPNTISFCLIFQELNNLVLKLDKFGLDFGHEENPVALPSTQPLTCPTPLNEIHQRSANFLQSYNQEFNEMGPSDMEINGMYDVLVFLCFHFLFFLMLC